MNRELLEAEVGRLLAEREELKRFGLRLGPKAEQRLKSILLSLGWTTELMKLQRRELLLRLAKRKYATQPGELAAMAASAVDNPHDTLPLRALSDYLNDNHPYEPVTEPFAGWVHGGEDFSRLYPILEPNSHRTMGPVNGSTTVPFTIRQHKFPVTDELSFSRLPGQVLWNVSKHRPGNNEVEEPGRLVRGRHLQSTRSKLMTPHVMQHLLNHGGLNSMIEAVMAHHVLRDKPDSSAIEGRENKKMLSRREQVLRRLARAAGVKRYAGALEPWKNQPAGPKPPPKIGNLARLDPDYAAGVAEDPSGKGKRAYFVFLRDKINEVEHVIGNRIASRGERIRPLVMSRVHRLARRLGIPIRYAKADSRHVAHPLVEGFPLETFLRHLSNDPANHSDIRELAKVALTGGKERDPSHVSMALWSLHDAMHEHKHPKADAYNLMSAGDKVGLDAHTYRALREASEDTRRSNSPVQVAGFQIPHANQIWSETPEAHATMAVQGMDDLPVNSAYSINRKQLLDRIRSTVKGFVPNATDEHIDESIRRHAHRAGKVWRRLGGFSEPEIDERDKEPFKERKYPVPRPHLNANEKATRYRRLLKRLSRINLPNTRGLKRYEMVAGDFIDALRRIRSEQQKGIRHTVETIAAKIGAKPASTVDALADGPHYSVPGVAQAIYSNTAPEKIHALAAWAGLTGNIPGMAVFHYRPDGPDMLHRFRMAGSGQELRGKLDKAGIQNRVLVPHRTGFDVLIPDQRGAMNDAVKNFTKQQKTELQTSRGHFKTIGSADQAKAREMFRNTITKQEQQPVRMAKKINPWFSHALRIIEEKVPNRATAEQIRKTLINNGVKPDELKWGGIDAFLGWNPFVDQIQYRFGQHNPGETPATVIIRPRHAGTGKLFEEIKTSPQELHQYVGREHAARIMSGESDPNQTFTSGFGNEWKVLPIDETHMGGEHHKRLYDQMIPQYLSKIGKQHGAGLRMETVSSTEGKTQEVPSMEITPKMRHAITTQGQALYRRKHLYSRLRRALQCR